LLARIERESLLSPTAIRLATITNVRLVRIYGNREDQRVDNVQATDAAPAPYALKNVESSQPTFRGVCYDVVSRMRAICRQVQSDSKLIMPADSSARAIEGVTSHLH
jgi:hypothetical protein